MSGEQLLQAIKALGRPETERWTMQGVRDAIAAAKAWDQANPEKSAEWRRLCAEFETQVKVEEEQERSLRHAERVARSLDRIGAQKGDFKLALESAAKPEHTYALEVTQGWLPGPKTFLVLAGEMGLGKSVASAWAVLSTLYRGGTAAMRRVREVATLSSYDEGAAVLRMLKTVDLLVLEDPGTEQQTGWGTSILFELLDTRHQSKLKTIITTNLNPKEELKARLTERVISRLSEAGHVVMLKGKSLRGGV